MRGVTTLTCWNGGSDLAVGQLDAGVFVPALGVDMRSEFLNGQRGTRFELQRFNGYGRRSLSILIIAVSQLRRKGPRATQQPDR